MAHSTELPNGNGGLDKTHTAVMQEHKAAIAPKRRKMHPKKLDDGGLVTSLCTLFCDHQIGKLAGSNTLTVKLL